jgi:putative Holliday junction resolvase
MRILALDYGSARCGVAVSDPTGVIATPLETVRAPRSPRGMSRLEALARELEVELVLVGLPLSLSGADSAQTREARGFAQALRRRLRPTPVELHDERFTTKLAQQDGAKAGARRAVPRAGEDSRAAAHLLESWLQRTSPTAAARG